MSSKRPLILLLVFILTISLAAAVPTVYGSGVTAGSHPLPRFTPPARFRRANPTGLMSETADSPSSISKTPRW